jgi:glutamate 5-kinase
MKKSLKYREIVHDVRRVVVKIGTRVLARKTGRPDTRCMRNLARELAAMQKSGHEVLVVTSGAIGAGMEALGMTKRPERLPDLQMAAAVGQTKLMSCYDRIFSELGCKIGQVLLTHDDFQHNIRLTNARRTLENLVKNEVIPIINENDVVADEEIKADIALGDNDLLASLLVKLVRADLLIMLSTVDGIRHFDKSGRSTRIRYLESITSKTYSMVTATKSHLSKGGMSSKLRAAQSVSKAGCAAIIANGRQPGILAHIMNGDDVGTMILASGL